MIRVALLAVLTGTVSCGPSLDTVCEYEINLHLYVVEQCVQTPVIGLHGYERPRLNWEKVMSTQEFLSLFEKKHEVKPSLDKEKTSPGPFQMVL
jgi:hypothetical protein